MAYLPTILRGADLEKSTVKSLQKELETKLGMGLSEKKNFIREQVRARIRIRILRLVSLCGFEILCNARDTGGMRCIDRYMGVVRRFVFVISHPSSSRSDDAVVAFIRNDENQFLPFEPCRLVPVH